MPCSTPRMLTSIIRSHSSTLQRVQRRQRHDAGVVDDARRRGRARLGEVDERLRRPRGSVTSRALNARRRRPRRVISATSASSRSVRRAPSTTWRRAAASRRAVASPMPLLAPVMATTFPSDVSMAVSTTVGSDRRSGGAKSVLRATLSQRREVVLEPVEAHAGTVQGIAAEQEVQRWLVGLDCLDDRGAPRSGSPNCCPAPGQQTVHGPDRSWRRSRRWRWQVTARERRRQEVGAEGAGLDHGDPDAERMPPPGPGSATGRRARTCWRRRGRCPASAREPAIDDTLTMWPQRCSRSSGRAARIRFKRPGLTANT